MFFSVSQPFFIVTEYRVWVCTIPYMCTTSISVFWQVCSYCQNLVQFMCNREGHLQRRSYKMLWWLSICSDDSSWPSFSHVDSFPLFSSPIFWRRIALHWKSCCDYVICWTVSNFFQSSYWLCPLFNSPLLFLPWFYMTTSPIYITLPHIFLSQSTLPSEIVVFPHISGSVCFYYPFLFLQNAGFGLVSLATSLPLLNFILKNCFFHDIYNKVDGYNGSVERHVHGPNRNSEQPPQKALCATFRSTSTRLLKW